MIKVKDSFFDFDKTVMAIFLLTGGILWIIIAALSEGCPMAGDAYSHYRISRYAFDHPELFCTTGVSHYIHLCHHLLLKWDILAPGCLMSFLQ